MGILQPILLNNNDNDNCRGNTDAGKHGATSNPARPMLPDNDGTEGPASVGPMAGSAFAGTGAGAANMTASLHNNDAFFGSTKLLGRGCAAAPPRLEIILRRNLWEVVQECKSDMSLSKGKHLWEVVQECKSDKSRSKIKHVVQVSHFGNKVNCLVLEALQVHNMMSSNAGLNAAASLEMASDASIAIDHDGGSSKPNAIAAPPGRDPRSLPPNLISLPGLSREVLALLTVKSKHSPRPSLYCCQRGKSIFEDSAWMPKYDAKVCIDGTLPKERDSKLLEVAWGTDFSADVAAAAAAEAAGMAALPCPPGHVQFSTERKDGSP